jgi:TolB protein
LASRSDWSPDGAQIMVGVNRSQQSERELCFVRLRDSSFDCLPGNYGSKWSPDGRLIAFYAGTVGGFALLRMEMDGNNETILAADIGSSIGLRPIWSPDGGQIGYSCDGDICIINADGNDPFQLINHGGTELNMDWSPDGNLVVFDSNVEDDYEIYLLNLETSHIRRLTASSNNDVTPVWRPQS